MGTLSETYVVRFCGSAAVHLNVPPNSLHCSNLNGHVDNGYYSSHLTSLWNVMIRIVVWVESHYMQNKSLSNTNFSVSINI